MSSRSSLKPVVAAVPVAVVANAPVPADTGIEEPMTVVPGRQIATKDEAVTSSNVVKVLRHIAAAGAEPPGNGSDAEEAWLELEQGHKPKVQELPAALTRPLVE